MNKIRCLDCKICTDQQHTKCIGQDQTYPAGSVYCQNVLDVLSIHWEHFWIIMSQIRHPDCKICTDQQHTKCIGQDQTYWAGSGDDQNVLDALCIHCEHPWIIMGKIRCQICSTGVVLYKITHTEQDLCMINVSWTCCVFIRNIPDVLWNDQMSWLWDLTTRPTSRCAIWILRSCEN